MIRTRALEFHSSALFLFNLKEQRIYYQNHQIRQYTLFRTYDKVYIILFIKTAKLLFFY